MFKEWSDKRLKRISLVKKRLSLSPPKPSNRTETERTRKQSAVRGAMQTVKEDIVQSLKGEGSPVISHQ